MKILEYATIRKSEAKIGNQLFLQNSGNLATEIFFKELYKKLNLQYAKFFKMDILCKLGFLTSELIIQNAVDNNYQLNEQTAVILSNSSSCLDTDLNFQATISDRTNNHPSPAIFVYTLPNIVIGEICIRNKFTGENMFFCTDTFKPDLIFDYVTSLYEEFKNSSYPGNDNFMCLAGWVEFFNDIYDAAFYLVGEDTNKEKKEFNIINIETIYREN